MKMKILKSVFVACGVLFLQSCTVGPDYQSPVVEMPDAWHQQLEMGLKSGQIPEMWWEQLNDETLNELVEVSRKNNPDTKAAFWSVIEARTEADLVHGRYWPEIDAIGQYSRRRNSDSITKPANGSNRAFNYHSIGLDTAWEIDLFGQIERSAEAAEADLQSEIESYRDVMVSLESEIAINYVNLRTTQERIKIANDNIDSQKETLKIATARYKSGFVPQLDIEQAKVNLANTQSTVPLFRQRENIIINRLASLSGQLPGEIRGNLAQVKPIPSLPESVYTPIPAETLRQRPDVRKSERELAAQTARIGAAEADLYPQFSLIGSFRFDALKLSGIGNGDNRAYGFGPAFRWNLFDGDRIKNLVRIEEAQTEQLYWEYVKAVLNAVEEVENSMYSYVQEIERLERLKESVVAAEKSVGMVQSLYKNGLTDFSNVLITERTLFTQQDSYAESKGQIIQNYVDLYRAFGGSWERELEN